MESSFISRKMNIRRQTSPRNPTRLNWSLPDLSVMILGGEGGVVLLFCLGSGATMEPSEEALVDLGGG
jgi:hypothetical protein